jgi:imidazolonepropionase-like amidohydrolase
MPHVVITNVRLIDGTGADPVSEAAIVVENDLISWIGPSTLVQHPPDSTVFDGTGCTVLPGLIDAHVHTAYTGAPDTQYMIKDLPSLFAIRSSVHAHHLLHAGLTAVRDGGSTAYADIALRQAVDCGLVLGPRIRACGYGLKMTGGHGDSFYRPGVEIESPGLVNNADEARKAARLMLKMGADHIKILSASGGVLSDGPDPGGAQFTVEEMRAAIDEAHKQGKRGMAHAHGSQAVRNAVTAGTDSVEHGSILDDDAIEIMLSHGTYYVPTLVATTRIVEHGVAGGIPPAWVEKAKRVQELHVRSFGRVLKAGVKIAMGTDAGTPYNMHGDNLTELALMVDAGMTPMQAIVAATQTGAELLDFADRLGTLAPGKLADIVVVRGDPISNIGLFRDRSNVVHVIKGGAIVRSALPQRVAVPA